METGKMSGAVGARWMYEASGDETYSDIGKKAADTIIGCVEVENSSADAKIECAETKSSAADASVFDLTDAGRILFFLYEKTGEEKYRSAIERIMERLRALGRCDCGVFADASMASGGNAGSGENAAKIIRSDVLARTLPFYMEYETRYDKKEKYNDIINQFAQGQKYLYDERNGLLRAAYDEASGEGETPARETDGMRLSGEGRYLAALVDTVEHTSVEIYEQYRKLCDGYKLLLRGVLRYFDAGIGLISLKASRGGKDIGADCGDAAKTVAGANADRGDAEGNALIGYSILKACRMGILLQEKYAPIGMAIAERLLADEDIKKEACDCAPDAFGMLYAQYLLFQKDLER